MAEYSLENLTLLILKRLKIEGVIHEDSLKNSVTNIKQRRLRECLMILEGLGRIRREHSLIFNDQGLAQQEEALERSIQNEFRNFDFENGEMI